jgi:L-alanine-DL-glutamate epimerase-like enolase superfamily enzyme
MELSLRPYPLELRHRFTIASGSRTTTPAVLVELHHEGFTGYGEASLPPYLGETPETVADFFSKTDLTKFDDPFRLETILSDIDATAPGHPAAKAALDIALHDLVGKLVGRPWYDLWGFDPAKTPVTTFTIGMDTPDIVRQKVAEAAEYKVLKIKLGGANDRQLVEIIREMTDKPICVDANQGWTDRHAALDFIHWLAERDTLFVEQPMPKTAVDDNAWLTERSPLPTVGDEAVQRLPDVVKAVGVYHGINIKLMKCTGMREAHRMVTLAKALGLKILLGCMTETSCAISAAAHLSPMADWADLDGALLIRNDCFDGAKIIDGKVMLNDRPGIGVRPGSGQSSVASGQ